MQAVASVQAFATPWQMFIGFLGRHGECSVLKAMGATQPVLKKEDDVWVVRVESEQGKVQEFRCATESQARQLAMVLAPKPVSLS